MIWGARLVVLQPARIGKGISISADVQWWQAIAVRGEGWLLRHPRCRQLVGNGKGRGQSRDVPGH
ncbi:hypothetical protein GCM10007924_06490 [Sneathiella chinensis]|uniref:Uncharacterized protein n=1 Tax=Sneathiella chinensis TaxID=349750 RepID=A0ABQ5U126_9PROT|nr:hypothetical protein GCM10007924_06490 [Sneathiella chinensis]